VPQKYLANLLNILDFDLIYFLMSEHFPVNGYCTERDNVVITLRIRTDVQVPWVVKEVKQVNLTLININKIYRGIDI